MHSDQINELATALAKAQGEMKAAAKDSENPHYRSKYADLASVWAACRGPLSKNGLAVIQTLDSAGADGLYLLTTLSHSSGQWMDSRLHLLLSKEDMQGLGSAITYARRYALAAIVGVAQEDDDAQSAVENAVATPAVTPRAAAGPSEAQLKRLFALGKKHFWPHTAIRQYILESFHIDSTKKLTREQYEQLCNAIQKTTAPAEDVPMEADSFTSFQSGDE